MVTLSKKILSLFKREQVYCINCKHLEIEELGESKVKNCTRLKLTNIDLVTGQPKKEQYLSPNNQRSYGFLDSYFFKVCGKHGRFYEPK